MRTGFKTDYRTRTNFMPELYRRIMAVDIGTKRVGAAISDPLGITTRSLGYLSCTGRREALEKVVRLVGEHSPDVVVIGVPINMDGSEGEMAVKARKFADSLRNMIPVPVETIDERLTTREAENILIDADVRRSKRKQVIDGMAATIILQKYLDKTRRNEVSRYENI
jgi:putative holliday junction resolvase